MTARGSSRVVAFAGLLGLLGLLACTGATEVDDAPVVLLEPVTAVAPQTATIGLNVPIVPTVRAVDASGRPVPGQRVRFAITAGVGILGQRMDTTDADGLASPGSWLLGYRVGEQELTAFLPDITNDVGVSFSVTAAGAAAATLTVLAVPDTFAIGDTTTLRLTFRDAWSNVVPPPTPPTFVSSDTLVARVGATGLVTATGFGFATITVASGMLSRVVAINVPPPLPPPPPPPPPPSVTATPVTIAQGYGIAIKGGTMLLPGFPASLVNRVDIASQTITRTIVTPDGAVDAAFHPTLPIAYVTGVAGNLHVIDLTTDSIVESIPIPGIALRVRVSADGGFVYVTGFDGVFIRVNSTTYETTPLQLHGGLNGLIVPETGDRLLVASMDGVVFVVSRSAFAVVDSVSIPGMVQDIVLGPDGSRFYVTSEDGALQARDFSTLALLASVVNPVGGGFGLGITQDGLYVVVARSDAASVSIFNAIDLEPYQSFAAPFPRRVALDPATGALWVTNQENSMVLRIDF